MDSKESDSEKSVVQFNSKQIGDILNKVNDLQNLILSMDPDTEKALKIQRGLTDLFSGYHELHRQLKNSKSQSLITDYISCNKINN